MNRIKKVPFQKTIKLTAIIALIVLEAIMMRHSVLVCHAQGTATVTASSAKIRESASADSTALAGVKANDQLTVVSQVTGSDGNIWYQVFVDGDKKGYIRSDLVTATGTIPTSTETTSSADTTKTENTDTADKSETTVGSGNVTVVGSGNKTSEATADDTADENAATDDTTQVSASTVATAKVIGSSVRVRSGASTDTDVAGNLSADTVVTVTGEVTASDGKLWYQITATSGDKTITGFVRSDFVEPQDMVEASTETEPQTEAATEPQTEAAPQNEDYSLEYALNDAGTYEWFLHDNIMGTKQSLATLLAASDAAGETDTADTSQVKNMKIMLIVLVAVLVLLIVVVTILLFKLKDAYYEYDEDDEDEEDEDDDEEEEEDDEEEEIIPVKRAPVKKSRPVVVEEERPRQKAVKRRVIEEDDDEEEEEEEIVTRTRKPERSSAGPKAPQSKSAQPKSKSQDKNWQSKNFLDIDDDMEFEFLDLK